MQALTRSGNRQFRQLSWGSFTLAQGHQAVEPCKIRQIFASLPTGAGRRVLGLLSVVLVSELRVERGLATGAVEGSLGSPVQRRVNCKVGPWEKVSNGGNLFKIQESTIAIYIDSPLNEIYTAVKIRDLNQELNFK